MLRPRFRNVHKRATTDPAKTDDTSLFDVAEDLFDRRVIFIDRDFTEQSCMDAIGKIVLLNLQTVKKPIVFLINSFGGEVYSTAGLIDAIETSKAPVYTYCMGIASSAGADLLISGHKRFMSARSSIMVHQAWYSDMGELTHAELLNFTAECERMNEDRIKLYMRKTGLTRKKIQALFAKDSYLSPKDALALNLIDEIGFDLYQTIK